MILRFIPPLLRSRYREIHDAQMAMGRHSTSAKKIRPIKTIFKRNFQF